MCSLKATVEPITKNIHTCIYPTLQNQANKNKTTKKEFMYLFTYMTQQSYMQITSILGLWVIEYSVQNTKCHF